MTCAPGVLDELRLVQNDGAEGELLQLLEVAPQQGVIRHDEVMLRNLLPQVVPRGAAFQHEHLQVRREAVGLAPPVVQHRGGADHERRFRVLPVPLFQPRQPRERLQGLAQAHVVRENAAEPDAGQVAEEVEPVLLIGPHLRLHGRGQLDGGEALEILEALAQRLGLGGIAEPLQPFLVQMRRLLQPDALRHRHQPIDAQLGHRFVRRLHRIRVQLHPAGVGQFDEPPGGRLQALQIGGRQLHPFLLPLGGDGQPINAAAFDHQPRTQLARRQEQPGEAGIAEIIGLRRAVGPGARELAQEAFVRVADPQPGLGREPIKLPQPQRRGLQARVIQNLGLVPGRPGLFRLVQLPLVAVPEPEALVALALGQQPQPHRLVEQLEDELRLRRVRHAKLLPVHAMARLRLAQVHQQAMAQLAHRHRRLAGPVLDHFRRRRVAQQIKRPPHQRQRRMAVEEPHLAQRVSLARPAPSAGA